MKSARAEALRLILPLLLRLATDDFFGTDDFRRLVEVVLDFDDLLFAEDRDEDDRDRPLSGPRLSMAEQAGRSRVRLQFA